MDSFHRRKLQCQREEANEQIPYAVAIVTRTAKNQGSWPWANRQHVAVNHQFIKFNPPSNFPAIQYTNSFQ